MNLPIKYAEYLLNGIKTKFAPITMEKAVYGADNRTLDQKIAAYDSNFSDAFSTTKAYAIGDYCIYLNRLYRFTAAKSAGAWDSTKVEAVSLSKEFGKLKGYDKSVDVITENSKVLLNSFTRYIINGKNSYLHLDFSNSVQINTDEEIVKISKVSSLEVISTIIDLAPNVWVVMPKNANGLRSLTNIPAGRHNIDMNIPIY